MHAEHKFTFFSVDYSHFENLNRTQNTRNEWRRCSNGYWGRTRGNARRYVYDQPSFCVCAAAASSENDVYTVLYCSVPAIFMVQKKNSVAVVVDRHRDTVGSDDCISSALLAQYCILLRAKSIQILL